MHYRLFADLVFLTHLAFIVFVMLGGFGALRWPRMIWLHIPAAVWGALIELFHWTCPLTPLEIELQQKAGAAGYSGGFIEHYLVPLIYPFGLNPAIQSVLGLGVVVTNVFVYAWVWRRRRRARSA